MQVINRAGPAPVALETTLLAHGVPRESGAALARELAGIVRARGASPAVVGILDGSPIVGMTDDEVARLLASADVPKVNTSNLGIALHRRTHGATTVSATLELAAGAGVRVFATGGIGGVHRDYGSRLDISADLAALARFPVAVVCSGVKSLLDVESTREALETLGIPVVGFRTDRFPAFYLRSCECGVDARFDEAADLAHFARAEIARAGRAVLIANPVPESDQISAAQWSAWLEVARRRIEREPVCGRDVTPALLSGLHEASGGATLRSNLALVRANTDLAAQLAVRIGS
ncbi:MAG: pseudouridine-5'-phosphate glycosidase [Phycisphaerales bacterium]